LGRILTNQSDHFLHPVHNGHQEGNPHVVVAFFEFADELLLRWVLQYHGGLIEVFGDVFEGIEDVHCPGAEKSLRARHLAVQQLIPHRWRIAILWSEGRHTLVNRIFLLILAILLKSAAQRIRSNAPPLSTQPFDV